VSVQLDRNTLSRLSERDLKLLLWRQKWLNTARPKQLPPDITDHGNGIDPEWTEWGLLAGRGFGKSLTGAQWLAHAAITDPEALPSYVIAPTLNDVRYTCFEGATGILTLIPKEIVKDYNRTNLIITLDNGAVIRGFSAEEPERLRGPQASRAWCFPGHTLVSMADGSFKQICYVKVGDEVVTRNGPRKVLERAMTSASADLWELVSDYGHYLLATGDHPIHANGRWVPLNRLTRGDELTTLHITGSMYTSKVLSTRKLNRKEPVFDLKIENDPEFFANSVLVHNCDELAAWSVADETWSMMMFGLRLGKNPKVVWTTTPKPKDIVRTLIKPKAHRHITSGSTYENKANLANSFFDQLAQYEGTQLGRQELLAEIIDAEEGGIINRSWLQLWPADKPFPKFDWIVMSLDTAMTAASVDKKTHNADPTACQVWGVFWHEDRTQLMMLDCWQDHLGFPDLLARVKKERLVAYGDEENAPIMKPLIGPARMAGSGRKPDIILIEDKGSGISLRQSLEREGIETYPYNPGNADKLSRLHMVSHIFAQKRVWLPESQKHPKKPRTWCDQAVTQWCSFRGERSIAHDDHVDAMSQAVRLCLDKQLLTEIKKSKPEREREDNERAPRYTPRGNPYAQ